MTLELAYQICYINETAARQTGSGTSQYKKLGKMHMDIGYGLQGAPCVGDACGSVFLLCMESCFAV
jgi:actin-like ATPase involved in cell morphogenesis